MFFLISMVLISAIFKTVVHLTTEMFSSTTFFTLRLIPTCIKSINRMEKQSYCNGLGNAFHVLSHLNIKFRCYEMVNKFPLFNRSRLVR